MRSIRLGLLVLGLALGSAAIAQGAVLDTQAVEVFGDNVLPLCRFTNLGTKPVSVLIEAVDGSPLVVDSEPRTVPAGATADVFPGTKGTLRCRFSGAFSKAKALALVGTSVDGTMTVAIPAR